MGIQLKTIVPWGRCLSEYVRMFNLTPPDKAKTILDCGAGPASFAAEMTQQGYCVLACDPIYQFSAAEIEQRIQATYTEILDQLRQHQDSYVWHEVKSPEHLGQVRMAAMQAFLTDFPVGFKAGRYQVAALPKLPFANQQFDLALSSHFLLTYSTHLGERFHWQAIDELCRVAQEIRIFPTLTLAGDPSPWLDSILHRLTLRGHSVELVTVSYEFQKGGNQMLRIVVKGEGLGSTLEPDTKPVTP
jgi:SAM-dependent methyltransferase